MDREKAKHKSLVDKLTYTYIRRIKKWMYCPACQTGKLKINKESTIWTCESCGYQLSADDFEDNYVFWFCDRCNTYLNNQEGFDRNAKTHICTRCGYENHITIDNLKGICEECGKTLPDPDTTLCADCKKARHCKTKSHLIKTGKIIGTVAAAAGMTYLAYKAKDGNFTDSSNLPAGDIHPDTTIRCANCGNTDINSLWDEGDTIYCSKCTHRTLKATGVDDLVECPYCHRMRDRKAMYCRWCNDSTWQASTPEEFEETDRILKEMGY